MAVEVRAPRPKNNLQSHLKWLKENHANEPPTLTLSKSVTAAPRTSDSQRSTSRKIPEVRGVPINSIPDTITKNKNVTPMRLPIEKNSANTVDLTLSSPPSSQERRDLRQSPQSHGNFLPPSSMKGITPIPLRKPGTQRQMADQISSSITGTRISATRWDEEAGLLSKHTEIGVDDESHGLEFPAGDFPSSPDISDRESGKISALGELELDLKDVVANATPSRVNTATAGGDDSIADAPHIMAVSPVKSSNSNGTHFGTHLLHLNNCKRMISLLKEQLDLKDKLLAYFKYDAMQSIHGIDTVRLRELQGEIDILNATMNQSESQAISHDHYVAFSQVGPSSTGKKRELKEIVLDESDFIESDEDEAADEGSEVDPNKDIDGSSEIEVLPQGDSEFDEDDNRELDQAFHRRGTTELPGVAGIGESVYISESDYEGYETNHTRLSNEMIGFESDDSDFEEVERFIESRHQSSTDALQLSDYEDNHCPPVLTQPANNQDAYPYYSGDGFPWDEEVLKVLNGVFKLQGFRFNQKQAINATLDSRDVLVLMPTGGGKSLCYQLPALVAGKTNGVTIVISPLISLMMDQVEQLRQKGVARVEYLSAAITKSRRSTILNLLVNDGLDILYLAPEAMDGIARIMEGLHESNRIARIVIDEAHCMSSWGHDFREHYLRLKDLKTLYPGVPIMALTATATPAVQEDIKTCLRSHPEPLVLKQSFNRTNLYYEVRDKTRGNNIEIADMIKSKFNNQTGIVYCFSRKDAEKTSESLKSCGIKASFYHAQMEPATKDAAQRDWQTGRTKVVCATIAFGMGIDKPDVRFVIHRTLPKTLEGYYQETGRAGRDGKQSVCILYFSESDAVNLREFIATSSDLPNSRKQVLQKMLGQVSAYCRNRVDCRRAQVLQYFSEDFDAKNCNGNCDNCKNRSKGTVVDYTSQAKHLAQLVKHVERQNVTAVNVASLYNGQSVKKMTGIAWNEIPCFGLGKELPNLLCRKLVNQMIAHDYLKLRIEKKGRFRNEYIIIGSNLSRLLRGEKFLVHIDDSDTGEHNEAPRSKRRRVDSESQANSDRRSNGNRASNSRSPYFAENNNASSRRRAGRPAAASKASTRRPKSKNPRSTGRRQAGPGAKSTSRTSGIPVMTL